MDWCSLFIDLLWDVPYKVVNKKLPFQLLMIQQSVIFGVPIDKYLTEMDGNPITSASSQPQ